MRLANCFSWLAIVISIVTIAITLQGCTAYIFWKAAQPEMKRARAAEKARFEASGMTKREWRNRPREIRADLKEDEQGHYWLNTYDDGSTRKEYLK